MDSNPYKARKSFGHYSSIARKKKSGFSLVEIIAVLAIMAVLASLSIPKFFDLGGKSGKIALRQAVAELNSRELRTWGKIKWSPEGWINDSTLFSELDTDLGDNYTWSPGASVTGGILHFRDQMIKLDRTASTKSSAGSWKITFESGG